MFSWLLPLLVKFNAATYKVSMANIDSRYHEKTLPTTDSTTNKLYTYFSMSNQGQASALKFAYVFKVFGAQSCVMVAQQFD